MERSLGAIFCYRCGMRTPCTHTLVLLLSIVSFNGCKQDIEQLDEGAVEVGKKAVGYIFEKAEQEQKAGEDQQQVLEKAIRDVQDLIAAGDLNKAEAKLTTIYWKPDPSRSMISDSNKELMRQYDERRQALAKVIERMRTANAAP